MEKPWNFVVEISWAILVYVINDLTSHKEQQVGGWMGSGNYLWCKDFEICWKYWTIPDESVSVVKSWLRSYMEKPL